MTEVILASGKWSLTVELFPVPSVVKPFGQPLITAMSTFKPHKRHLVLRVDDVVMATSGTLDPSISFLHVTYEEEDRAEGPGNLFVRDNMRPGTLLSFSGLPDSPLKRMSAVYDVG